jgi:hypothetical protein
MIKYKETTEFYKAVAVSEVPRNFKGVRDVVLDIYNEGAGINFFSLACTTGPSWEWHESKAIRLAPGWNRNIKIRVSGNFWKAQRTENVNRAGLRNAEDVRRLALCFWGKGGTVYADNLRATGTGIRKAIPDFMNNLVTWESFEGKTKEWVKPAWKSQTATVSASRQNVSDGEQSLKLDFLDITPTASAAVSCDFRADWSSVKKIYVDIFNDTGTWMKFGMIMATGDQFVWNETAPRFLNPGWNRNVCFNLDEPQFKNEKTEWKNAATLDSRHAMQRIGLSVSGLTADQKISGSVFFDNIKVENSYEEQK